MRIEFQSVKCPEVSCDMLAYPVFEDEPRDSQTWKWLGKATRGVLDSALASGEFKPELHQILRIHRPSGVRAGRLLLVGAGPRDKFTLALLREVAGTAVRGAHAAACKTLALVLTGRFPAGELARVTTEGALYGDYESDTYKTRDREARYLENFILVSEVKPDGKVVEEGIRRGTVTGEATNLARALANEPANILTPSQFAERAAAVASRSGLDLQILEREDMDRLGMNTLLAVSRGSAEPPKLMILRIREQERKTKGPLYGLIGKGVTFDSGGISIKPAEKMEDMKADMAGGAAVLGAMSALGQLHPRHRVIGLIPAVENLPGGRATKPGDVVKSYLGKTVEIINTDAEGRLILADAIAYARTLGADHLIDVATLTGACVIALGMVNAGMLGTDDKTMERLRNNCAVTGEKLWQLPLDEEYRKAIRSEIADIKNVGNRWAGAITAAKFLQEFVEETPWVHLDIAGMDLDHEGRPFACKGATGFGVRTLVQLLS
jgi:leucyl aminopeptidase